MCYRKRAAKKTTGTRMNTRKFSGATSVREKWENNCDLQRERDERGSGGALARLRAVSFATTARKGGRDGDSEIQLKILRVTCRENVQLPFKSRVRACSCVCAFEALKSKGECVIHHHHRNDSVVFAFSIFHVEESATERIRDFWESLAEKALMLECLLESCSFLSEYYIMLHYGSF